MMIKSDFLQEFLTRSFYCLQILTENDTESQNNNKISTEMNTRSALLKDLKRKMNLQIQSQLKFSSTETTTDECILSISI